LPSISQFEIEWKMEIGNSSKASRMAKTKSINLLPQEEFDASIVGRILIWAMGSFRVIVILTEMVVMGAFLSRFWFDAQNSDLSDSIKVASAQITAQSDFEKEFRGVQQKLSIFNQLAAVPASSSKVDLVSSTIPQDLLVTSISVQENIVLIKGTAGSEFGVAQFISNLKADPRVKKVELGSVGSSENNQALITFSLNVTF
jgi:Tfp pilus assembly protein PilN